jgi:hypothetical protein
MAGEKNLIQLIKGMSPHLNDGEYVFSTVEESTQIKRADILCEFKEREGVTIILERTKAEELNLDYNYVASWITLKVHSSLEAVGLTALFSTKLAEHDISCNVIAGYYHDHIFVDVKNSKKAMLVLQSLSNNYL